MFIYKITNKINGKIYIGKTTKTLENRFKNHLKAAENKVNRYLYDAMNHYGYENFEINLIECCNSLGELNDREIFWIQESNCIMPNGYNMTKGGDGGNTLLTWSDEEKTQLWERQGKKRTGIQKTDECKKKMSEFAILRESKKTDQEKEIISRKISKTLKDKYASGELIANTPRFYGEEHHQYVIICIDDVLHMIKNGSKLIEIAKKYETTTNTVGSRLKQKTGKTFNEWRKHYGLNKSYSKSKKSN